MNRTKLNYWIDIGLAISFFICFITGIIKWPGLIKIIGIDLFRMLYFSNISRLHDVSGLVMGILVLIHLILHWGWIVSVTKNIIFKKNKK